MMLYNLRYTIFRRFIQLGFIVLFILGNNYGYKILVGNISSSLLFDKIPLSDPFALLQGFLAGGIFATQAIIGGVIVLALYGILLGRAFCAFVCPMNLVTDMANFIADKLNLAREIAINRNLRYLILVLTLVLSFLFALPAFEVLSPIGILSRGLSFGFGFGFFAILMIFILDMLVTKRAFCGHLCPLGAFYSIIGKYSLLKVRHIKELCSRCGECERVCPEVQVLDIIGKTSANVKNECISCGKCIEVCHDDALKFSINLKNK